MGQFAEARDFLLLGLELGTQESMWMDALGARTLLARVALETGDLAEAEATAREALEFGNVHGLQLTPTYAFTQTVKGTVLVRRGDAEAGAALLEAALPGIRAIREPLALGELYAALAMARRMTGRIDEATELLRELDVIIERSRHPGYLRTLRRMAAPAREAATPEQLSRREREVLRVLARGRSKRETADDLFVSYNTVHSHVRSIYRKLDVHSLAAALARARQRGLIE
jgi:LuxR family maltose regulon positive regulatory protein